MYHVSFGEQGTRSSSLEQDSEHLFNAAHNLGTALSLDEVSVFFKVKYRGIRTGLRTRQSSPCELSSLH